jgi:hypothetical protein
MVYEVLRIVAEHLLCTGWRVTAVGSSRRVPSDELLPSLTPSLGACRPESSDPDNDVPVRPASFILAIWRSHYDPGWYANQGRIIEAHGSEVNLAEGCFRLRAVAR